VFFWNENVVLTVFRDLVSPEWGERFGCNPDFPCWKTKFFHGTPFLVGDAKACQEFSLNNPLTADYPPLRKATAWQARMTKHEAL
jgi:hypothetical protein